MYPLQACVRLAVKLDFITALLKKSLECTGTWSSAACRRISAKWWPGAICSGR
jgi:aromatic ring hydroxylase